MATLNDTSLPNEPAQGRTPPPIKRKPKVKKSSRSNSKPVPQPGKYEPVINFSCMQEETEASRFDLNLVNVLDDLLRKIARRSQDALVRMNYKKVDEDAIFENLQMMTNYYLAAKLLATATHGEESKLNTFRSIKRALDDAPIPTPIVDIVNTIGNFQTSDEKWRINGLIHKFYTLTCPQDSKYDEIIRADIDWASFINNYSMDDLRELEVIFKFDTTTFVARPTPTIDFTDDTQVDTLVALCEPGTNLGQADEVKGRSIIAKLFQSKRIPPPTERAEIITAFQRSFSIDLHFDLMVPSAIKAMVSSNVGDYRDDYMDPLSRVWLMSNATELSDQGASSQLLTFNLEHTAGDGPLPTTPSNYCLTQNGEFEPEIISRSFRSWKSNTDYHHGDLLGLTLKKAKLVD